MVKIASIILVATLLTTLGISENFFRMKTTKSTVKLETINNLQQYGVEIIKPTDDSFNSTLKEYIGDKESVIPLIEAAKPFTLFIKNNSPKDIVGVSLRWQVTKSNGETLIIPQSESTPGELMGMKPVDPWMIGKTSLLSGNSARFFSFFNSVERIIVSTNTTIKYPNAVYNVTPELLQKILTFIEDDQKQNNKEFSNISVSVDGVFFSDGTFVGDNQNLYFESMNGQLQARKDFIRTIKEAKSSNKADSEILAQSIAHIPDKLSSSEKSASDKDAFEQSYKLYLNSLKKEINKKRSKFADEEVVSEFLSVQDSDFVTIQKTK